MSTRLYLNISLFFCIVTFVASSCDDKISEKYSGTTSSCDGFRAFSNKIAETPSFIIDSASYCEAERLWWQYDSIQDYLSFLHTRINLNCAAKLTITAQVDGNTITFNETDTASDIGGQATCNCCFDTYLEIQRIQSGIFLLNISSKTFSINTKDMKGFFVLDSTIDSVCLNNL
jgi:hypothetical protein